MTQNSQHKRSDISTRVAAYAGAERVDRDTSASMLQLWE